tara:strand:+ start:305 stop:883 length:579 start_codon:yes stop_codon:yes gene_type:complete
MALSEYNIKVELREILLKDRPNELLNISPKGTVPVLQLPNKNVLDESLDIINWVLNNNDSNWRETNYEEQQKMIKNNDEEFKHYLDRYKYNDRYPEKSKEFYQKKCEVYLKNYEEKLTENMFLVSDKMQIVDIAIFPFLRQYAFVNKLQFSKSFVKLNNYLERILNTNLFKSIMQKYPVWSLESEKIITDFN